MALTDYVIMPGEDYQAICDAVREKRNETEAIKSGEIAGKIQEIEVTPKLQDKNVIPRTESQIVIADEGYDGLGAVTIAEAPTDIDPLAAFIGKFKVAMIYGDTIDDDFHISYLPCAGAICDSLFSKNSALVTAPMFDASKVTSMVSMFSSCNYLLNVPLYDTSNVTNMNSMFSPCYSLRTVPLFDTRKVTGMSYMFQGCGELVEIPSFDIRNVVDTYALTYFVESCTKLTDCRLRNITTNLQVGSGTSYGHLLTLDSLIHLIKECRDTGSLKTLTVGSANLEKLANVYVRTIEITDEMRAEDDLIDEKLPFEVCESTDEGAMLIVDYAVEKNWSIK